MAVSLYEKEAWDTSGDKRHACGGLPGSSSPMPPYVMRVPSFQPGFTGISSTSCAAHASDPSFIIPLGFNDSGWASVQAQHACLHWWQSMFLHLRTQRACCFATNLGSGRVCMPAIACCGAARRAAHLLGLRLAVAQDVARDLALLGGALGQLLQRAHQRHLHRARRPRRPAPKPASEPAALKSGGRRSACNTFHDKICVMKLPRHLDHTVR